MREPLEELAVQPNRHSPLPVALITLEQPAVRKPPDSATYPVLKPLYNDSTDRNFPRGRLSLKSPQDRSRDTQVAPVRISAHQPPPPSVRGHPTGYTSSSAFRCSRSNRYPSACANRSSSTVTSPLTISLKSGANNETPPPPATTRPYCTPASARASCSEICKADVNMIKHLLFFIKGKNMLICLYDLQTYKMFW